jgi:hypothetical protein
MFDIRLLPASELGPDGQRLGRITVGDWSETFSCYPVGQSVEEMAEQWKERLGLLLRGAEAVALVHDPRLAYVVYREGNRCFVQEHLDVKGAGFAVLRPRETVSDEGQSISEWETSLSAIAIHVGA